MTPEPPRPQPRLRALEAAVREELRACAQRRFASPHVTPVARRSEPVAPERAV